MGSQQMRSRTGAGGRGMHKDSIDPLREQQALEENDVLLLQQAQAQGYTTQLSVV